MNDGDVSSGIAAFDDILKGLRPGDNVVFQVEKLSDYSSFTEPFLKNALADGNTCVYIRFAPYQPVVENYPRLEVIEVDPGQGFDHFSREVHHIAEPPHGVSALRRKASARPS
jgi:adenosine deaminase